MDRKLVRELGFVLIEDTPEIADKVLQYLRRYWPVSAVKRTGQGNVGIRMVKSEHPDIIILNTDLPDMSGFEVLNRVRQFSNIPVIILSTSRDEANEVKGLDTGADEYIVWPSSPTNLVSRVMAILRRAGIRVPDQDSSHDTS